MHAVPPPDGGNPGHSQLGRRLLSSHNPEPSSVPPPSRPLQRAERNPQTLAFLDLLGLPYNLDYSGQAGGGAASAAAAAALVQGEGLVLFGPALQPWGSRRSCAAAGMARGWSVAPGLRLGAQAPNTALLIASAACTCSAHSVRLRCPQPWV